MAETADDLYWRGFALWGKNKPHDALVIFEKALAINPNHINSLHHIGLIYMDLYRYEDAITFFNKIILIDKKNVAAWKGKGYLLMKLGKLDEARKCFHIAAMLEKGH